jgi:hypothetical protein
MAELVTLAAAKAHLNLFDAVSSPLSVRDQDLQDKLDQATELIVDYLTQYDTTWAATVASWDVTTAPLVVRAAILRQTAELYRFRGDDPENDGPAYEEGGGLAPCVTQLLKRLRDPALA